MGKKELIQKIMQRKEFSELPVKDVEMILSMFDEKDYVDSEKIKLTRDLLQKVYTSFTSQKIFSRKFLLEKNPEKILCKHISTRDRFEFYEEVYSKLLKGVGKKVSVIDLGCGVNGFSFNFFKKVGFDVEYFGVEAMGQLVDLSNDYFKGDKISGKVVHGSLFDLEKIKGLIKKTKKPRVVFLFKVIDSLEMLKRNYSKKLLKEIVPLVDRVIVSFATKSLIKGSKFKVQRTWLLNFVKENFNLIDDFEVGNERYIVFEKQ